MNASDIFQEEEVEFSDQSDIFPTKSISKGDANIKRKLCDLWVKCCEEVLD